MFAQYPPTLYVRRLWGGANRFRTLNVAFDLARTLNVDMVILENDDAYWSAKMNELCVVPFPTQSSPPLKVMPTDEFLRSRPKETYVELNYNVDGDCSRRTTVAEVRTIVNSGKSAVIYACGLFVDLPRVSDDFYRWMRLTPQMEQALGPMVRTINEKRAVGVHVRLGSTRDAQNSWFFTKWEGSTTRPPVFCCSEDPKKNLSSCPSTAVPIERFVNALKKFGPQQTIFVSGDRVGCLLWLLQEFPDQIVYNERRDLVENKVVDSVTAFKDWWCLGECSKLVLSGISSFSGESMKRKGVSAEFL